MSSPPPGNGTTLLAGGTILAALVTLALLLPLAPCPVCPPNIFTITTNVAVPGAPITSASPVACECLPHGGRVSALARGRAIVSSSGPRR